MELYLIRHAQSLNNERPEQDRVEDPVRSKYSAERHLPPHSALTPCLVPKSQPLDFV